MRTYAVLYSASTEQYTVIFRDDWDLDGEWYVETDLPEITRKNLAKALAKSLNDIEREKV